MGEDTREIRNEVEQAREQLGETVEALAYKVNAPRRLRENLSAKAARVKAKVTSNPGTEKVRDRVDSLKQTVEEARKGDGPVGNGDARR